MKKIKFKKKFNWRTLLAGILTCALAVGAVAGITAIVNNDTKTISPAAFSRGDLDSEGIYIESNTAVYTKEAFGAIGLRIEQDFDSRATYDVFYYDHDGRFIEAKEGLNGVYDEDYPLAKLARVVIHPEIPVDVDADEFKIKFYEVSSIASEFKITVNKDQTYKYETKNLYSDDEAEINKTFNYGADGKTVTITDSTTQKLSGEIPVVYKNYDVFLRVTEEVDEYAAAVILTADNELVRKVDKNMDDLSAGEWVKIELNLKSIEDGYNLLVKMPKNAECYIFGYGN